MSAAEQIKQLRKLVPFVSPAQRRKIWAEIARLEKQK